MYCIIISHTETHKHTHTQRHIHTCLTYTSNYFRHARTRTHTHTHTSRVESVSLAAHDGFETRRAGNEVHPRGQGGVTQHTHTHTHTHTRDTHVYLNILFLIFFFEYFTSGLFWFQIHSSRLFWKFGEHCKGDIWRYSRNTVFKTDRFSNWCIFPSKIEGKKSINFDRYFGNFRKLSCSLRWQTWQTWQTNNMLFTILFSSEKSIANINVLTHLIILGHLQNDIVVDMEPLNNENYERCNPVFPRIFRPNSRWNRNNPGGWNRTEIKNTEHRTEENKTTSRSVQMRVLMGLTFAVQGGCVSLVCVGCVCVCGVCVCVCVCGGVCVW